MTLMTNAYLTAISYPPGAADRSARAALLAPAVGVDEQTLRLRTAKAPPFILGMFPRDAAERGAAALVNAGGDGFVCALEDLQRLGPSLKVRDLRIAAEGLVLELWRGPTATIDPSDIEVIVRASVGDEVMKSWASTGRDVATHAAEVGIALTAGAGYGWAIRMHREQFLESLHNTQPTPLSSHKLDIHTKDGRVFQIDGDKFGYEILGELRGHSDHANIDRMVELLSHFNTDVVVDEYFRLWNPPPGHHRLRVPMMQLNGDDPAFLFYSRWAALMYRHVMGVA